MLSSEVCFPLVDLMPICGQSSQHVALFMTMQMPLIFTTKLYVPQPPPEVVVRPRLIQQLDKGLHRKLTLVSAPAGFGKTTLISAWIANLNHSAAWLSLDEGDNDPVRFITYLIAALQTIEENFADGILGALQSPQPPPIESLLPDFVNQLHQIPQEYILVLDDYHVIDVAPVDTILSALVDHMPPQMHLVITTREDPPLPLARLRARGKLTEIRAADLRFSADEAAEFLNQVMGLNLSAEDVAALETRTEGWIVGLQLAAISMQGEDDASGFIESFTGSHHFVLDYLLEEVLNHQPQSIQDFLLKTSILDRLCGSLCDALIADSENSGQDMLETVRNANLFLIPLDNERRWYRYHHLFADLLRRRLQQLDETTTTIPELHSRTSQWYEENGLEIEAFQHAAAAGDIERAALLIEGNGSPLYYRGAATIVTNWLDTLPNEVMDSKPSLWVTFALALTTSFRNDDVRSKLQAAEAALRDVPLDDENRDLIGQIAAMWAAIAAPQYDVETTITQSKRALEYLHPDNLPVRTMVSWLLGYGHYLQGDRVASKKIIIDTIELGRKSGNVIFALAAATNLGILQENENRLDLAEKTFRDILQMAGDPLSPGNCEAYLGLARSSYEWNDLAAAEEHVQTAAMLADQIHNIDTPAACGHFYARLRMAQGDLDAADEFLAEAEQFAQQRGYERRMLDIAETKVRLLIERGDVVAAGRIAENHDLLMSQARVHLAQDDLTSALQILNEYEQDMLEKGWLDEQLKVKVLQAIVLDVYGEEDVAIEALHTALEWAKPSGYCRLFVDEGEVMAELLAKAAGRGIMPDYTRKLLAAFELEAQHDSVPAYHLGEQPLIEPLSDRELEILQLVADGLSNREISERLYLALSTVKGHNRNIYDKLQVQRRTEAVARARELGLLQD